ncbi:BrnA antitoxin family protein [Streptomyces sp. NBC_00704]|uniref:hypothetical protein n=1 Tax=Streptomyces sp. NBC_00704 TaxID=2975809 RepID=UPI002E36BC99|nr:hypothetical protein [Streptomyces sp. NBC_00704]
MTGEELRPQAESPQELNELALRYQSTSIVDMESEEVPIESSRMPMVSRSIRMEQSVMSEIRKVAARRGIPVTQLMRQWVQQGLEQAQAEESASNVHPAHWAASVVITSAAEESTQVSPEQVRLFTRTVRGRYELGAVRTALTSGTRTRDALNTLMHRHADGK